jgi:hypothetical protein
MKSRNHTFTSDLTTPLTPALHKIKADAFSATTTAPDGLPCHMFVGFREHKADLIRLFERHGWKELVPASGQYFDQYKIPRVLIRKQDQCSDFLLVEGHSCDDLRHYITEALSNLKSEPNLEWVDAADAVVELSEICDPITLNFPTGPSIEVYREADRSQIHGTIRLHSVGLVSAVMPDFEVKHEPESTSR